MKSRRLEIVFQPDSAFAVLCRSAGKASGHHCIMHDRRGRTMHFAGGKEAGASLRVAVLDRQSPARGNRNCRVRVLLDKRFRGAPTEPPGLELSTPVRLRRTWHTNS